MSKHKMIEEITMAIDGEYIKAIPIQFNIQSNEDYKEKFAVLISISSKVLKKSKFFVYIVLDDYSLMILNDKFYGFIVNSPDYLERLNLIMNDSSKDMEKREAEKHFFILNVKNKLYELIMKSIESESQNES